MHRNSILNALAEDERQRVRQFLEPVVLNRKQVLYDAGRAIDHVYFITEGVASVITFFSNGNAIETATIGNEGIVGLPVFLGVRSVSEQCFVQIPGAGFRMGSDDFLSWCETSPKMRAVLNLYTAAMLRMLAQSSACNRRHSIEQRCARWLLMTHDRAGRDTFELTQQFLSEMLGVRRATVSQVAKAFQQAGCIEYTRGRIRIIDRSGLECQSCECYKVIQREFSKLLAGENDESGPQKAH